MNHNHKAEATRKEWEQSINQSVTLSAFMLHPFLSNAQKQANIHS